MNNFFKDIPENISVKSSESNISDLTCPFSEKTDDKTFSFFEENDFDKLTQAEIINIKKMKKVNLSLIDASHNNTEIQVPQDKVKCGCSFLTLLTWRKG